MVQWDWLIWFIALGGFIFFLHFYIIDSIIVFDFLGEFSITNEFCFFFNLWMLLQAIYMAHLFPSHIPIEICTLIACPLMDLLSFNP